MGADLVILLHGIACSNMLMARLEIACKKAGFTTLNLDYPSRSHDVMALADWVAKESKQAIAKADNVHYIGFSLGGLIARALLGKNRPKKLGRCVHIGTPHYGSELADLLGDQWLYRHFFGPAGQELRTNETSRNALPASADYPLGIIAGTLKLPFNWCFPAAHDGKVSVASTQWQGASDHLIVNGSHGLLPYHPEVCRQAIYFLQHGEFKRA